MRILVSNDDGIGAPGLEVLERIARKLSDDVWTVAPEQEQSGAAHSLSLYEPVRLRKLSDRRFAVSGTPTDCVLMALQEVIPNKKKVDLVLSGINAGSNAGDDVTYSGTVAAAMEGTVLGVPSIALSQLTDDKAAVKWHNAEKYAPEIIKKLVKCGWPENVLMNVNFPDVPLSKVKGISICPQGKRRVGVSITGRVDPKKRPYYWLGGERDNTANKPGVDIDLLYKGHVTITPLCMDMTDYKMMETLRKNCAFD